MKTEEEEIYNWDKINEITEEFKSISDSINREINGVNVDVLRNLVSDLNEFAETEYSYGDLTNFANKIKYKYSYDVIYLISLKMSELEYTEQYILQFILDSF